MNKSGQLREGIEEILDNFGRRLQNLQENVMPMHEANGQLQVKQQSEQISFYFLVPVSSQPVLLIKTIRLHYYHWNV